MVRATGIYIRDDRIQAAEVDGNRRNPRLRSLVTRHLEEGDGGVAVLLEQSDISRRRVYLVLPSRLVRFRKVVLPHNQVPG